jgi:hypothetical protein
MEQTQRKTNTNRPAGHKYDRYDRYDDAIRRRHPGEVRLPIRRRHPGEVRLPIRRRHPGEVRLPIRQAIARFQRKVQDGDAAVTASDLIRLLKLAAALSKRTETQAVIPWG